MVLTPLLGDHRAKRCISYTQLDMMAQMRDKMREDFVKMDLEYKRKRFGNVKGAARIRNG